MKATVRLYAVSAHIVHRHADRTETIHQLPSFLLSDVQAADTQDATRVALDIISNHPTPDAANTYVVDVVAL